GRRLGCGPGWRWREGRGWRHGAGGGSGAGRGRGCGGEDELERATSVGARESCAGRVLLDVIDRQRQQSLIKGLPARAAVRTVKDADIGSDENAVAAEISSTQSPLIVGIDQDFKHRYV